MSFCLPFFVSFFVLCLFLTSRGQLRRDERDRSSWYPCTLISRSFTWKSILTKVRQFLAVIVVSHISGNVVMKYLVNTNSGLVSVVYLLEVINVDDVHSQHSGGVNIVNRK